MKKLLLLLFLLPHTVTLVHSNEVSLYIPPDHNLTSVEKIDIDGEKFHKNIGYFYLPGNRKIDFEEVIQVFGSTNRLIYNEQKQNGQKVQEFSVFDKNKDIYVVKTWTKEFEPFNGYFCRFSIKNGCKPYQFIYIEYSSAGDIKNISKHGITNDDVESYKNKLNINFEKNKTIFLQSNPTQTQRPTPSPTPTVSIDDAKKECDELGFKKGTKKFKNCVVELM